jgi:chromosome segregation ATPase
MDAKDSHTDMSRTPTILLGSVLLSGVAWTAVAVDDIPLALAINGAIAGLLGQKAAATNYADAIFTVLCLLVAAGVGVGIGWSMRASTARAREADLQRRLNDTKGRIPRLESGMRNKEMQVARIEQQMKDLESLLPPLHKTIEERDIALRDRDRTVSMLRGELAVLKGAPLAADTPSAAMATLDLEDDTFTTSASSGYSTSLQTDARNQVLEERVRELETKVREREARIAELMYEQGNHAKKIPQLESELGDQRKRNEDFDRERQRQDKWLDVLNDQLARARETNDKLSAQLKDRASLQQRIVELEVELKRLGDEIADRERRLAASRFECATARTAIAHLQSQLDAKKGASAGAK